MKTLTLIEEPSEENLDEAEAAFERLLEEDEDQKPPFSGFSKKTGNRIRSRLRTAFQRGQGLGLEYGLEYELG